MVAIWADISAGLFHADDVGEFLKPFQRGRFDVNAGASLHAVDDDRQLGRRGDGLVVLVEPFLGGFVVVRRDREDTVHAQRLQLLDEVDDFSGVIAACAGEHRNDTLGLFERDFDDAEVLGVSERGAFAGGAAGHQEMNSGFDLTPDQGAQSVLVE